MRTLFFVLALILIDALVSLAKAEEVRVVFTDQGGPVVNNVLGLTWTHTLIRFEGDAFYYEATWPRVRRSPAFRAVAHTTITFEAEASEVAAMKAYARSRLGVPYNFRGYFRPRWYGRTRGVYCSQYVNNILRAGGVPLAYCAGHSPDSLLAALRELYGQ